MYQNLYQGFLKARPDVQHFACHSHHYWPDVTREATLQYWDDSARLVDEKWSYFFSEKVPRAQSLIARLLKVPNPQRIVFAPNTHEFVMRLFSCFSVSEPLRVLTTDSEFYSFDRQAQRLSETGWVQVEKVPVEPFSSFHERFEEALRRFKPQMVFFSHVFFNSGMICDIHRLAKAAATVSRMTVIDAYHGFLAVPTDLSQLPTNTFYLSGSYKYAQAGEGCCFLIVPEKSEERPTYTGWFAELATLDTYSGKVGYPQGGLRFAGSTMDFTALYRLIAVLDLFEGQGISVEKIHTHIQKQQSLFLAELDRLQHPLIHRRNLIVADLSHHGHFFSFQMPSEEKTKELQGALLKAGVATDSRKDRLRFGFGLYHEGPYQLDALLRI